MTVAEPRVRGSRARLLWRRPVLVALAGSVATGLVFVAIVAWSVQGLTARGADQVLDDRTAAARAAVTTGPGALVRVDADRVEPGTVVYDGDGVAVAGRPLASLAATYRELATSGSPTTRTVGDDYRLRATPLTGPDGTRFTVVAVAEVRGYESARRLALLLAFAAAAALVLVATSAAAWVGRQTMHRVDRIARTAQAWSRHDLDRRFDVASGDPELNLLADTLNGLLDQVSGALTAERRLTAEIAHELRSPLAAVQGLADLLALRDDLDDAARQDVAGIRDACARMARTIATLLDAARLSPGGARRATSLPAVVDALVQALPPGRTVELPDRESATSVAVGVPLDVAVRTVGPLLDNALRHGDRARLVVDGGSDGEAVAVHVDDDGPGPPEVDRERIFLPGVSSGTGAGLGLPLARRLARELGGDVTTTRTEDGWTRFTVRLPGASPDDPTGEVAGAAAPAPEGPPVTRP
ncbi:sensor histidine kinase [Nocardioides sp. GCM10027113]|uniref:sensor histidine kinase n=1 Tax=unclassified Nocardioides TaxID=2615069 RepID=UPI003619D983